MANRAYVRTVPVMALLFPFLILGSSALRDKMEIDRAGERQEDNYRVGRDLGYSGKRHMSGRGHRD